jgi:glutathione S-transferase
MANQTAERIALKLAAGSPTQQIFTTRNEEMLRYLDVELSTRPYLAGAEFTAADIMMEFPLAFCERRLGRSLAPYPNVVAFHRRVTNRPAFARATARVGDSL